jgi:hypothetical protein
MKRPQHCANDAVAPQWQERAQFFSGSLAAHQAVLLSKPLARTGRKDWQRTILQAHESFCVEVLEASEIEAYESAELSARFLNFFQFHRYSKAVEQRLRPTTSARTLA